MVLGLSVLLEVLPRGDVESLFRLELLDQMTVNSIRNLIHLIWCILVQIKLAQLLELRLDPGEVGAAEFWMSCLLLQGTLEPLTELHIRWVLAFLCELKHGLDLREEQQVVLNALPLVSCLI